ncbi:MAG TPA: transglycosylase SLT domain-containing protein [Xanthobacteraceae bacterium]|nr:transglycosylase SLT domain-containing protein [Xanthobacteraceae bacterium]
MSVDVTGAIASVTSAIRQAAQKTGASFHYLLATARVESNLNPTARASSSSASGLFQFLEQTWLSILKHAGPALGYGRYADAISINSAGRYEVANPGLRRQILDLRYDPTANALMAGALTQWNGEWLATRLGRQPSEGELYLAHFLGPAGAAKLIALAAASPQTRAMDMFPSAASANRAIFYDKQGTPRSVAQVYDLVVARYAIARARSLSGPTDTAMAQAAPTPRYTFPLSLVAQSLPTSGSVAISAARAKEAGSVFHSLFHATDRREPIAPVVTALWGGLPPSSGSQAGETNPARPVNLLQLFHDKS